MASIRRLDNGFNNNISCDSVNPMAIGIVWFSWWPNPYIAGYCYHLNIAQDYRRAKAVIAGSTKQLNEV
jgi:hypothetical protein